jgi:hypothetical protein
VSSEDLHVIARAIARSGLHYKKSSISTGVVALAVCLLALVIEEPPQKGVALALAVLLAVFTYRSIRASQRHFDLESSPVLAAIARAPRQIRRVSCARPKADGPWLVTVEDAEAHRLTLRLPPETEAEEMSRLLGAFAAVAPEAAVERGPLEAQRKSATRSR